MLTARALGDEWPQPLTPSARDAVRREGTFDGPYARWRSRAVRARGVRRPCNRARTPPADRARGFRRVVRDTTWSCWRAWPQLCTSLWQFVRRLYSRIRPALRLLLSLRRVEGSVGTGAPSKPARVEPPTPAGTRAMANAMNPHTALRARTRRTVRPLPPVAVRHTLIWPQVSRGCLPSP